MLFPREKILKPIWPNCLLVGAPKCGTSSLYSYLQQHPDIFFSAYKEPHFFAYHNETLSLPIDDQDSPEYQNCKKFFDKHTNTGITDIKSYLDLFKPAKNEKIIAEASTTSLYHPKTIENIKAYIPNAKFIAIIRNPVERAFSAYQDAVRKNNEYRSFEEAIDKEPIDSEYIWWGPGELYYIRPGFYSKQIQRYYDNFDRNQLHVVIYDDFRANPKETLKGIFEFLEVDASFDVNVKKNTNISGVPTNGTFDSLVNKCHSIYSQFKSLKDIKNRIWTLVPKSFKLKIRNARRNKRIADHFNQSSNSFEWKEYYNGEFTRPVLSEAMKSRLTDLFREDIKKLETLLERDLSHWISE